jgi:hypothetical protein
MKRRKFLLGLAAGSAVLATPISVAAQRRLTDAERFAVLTSDIAGWRCVDRSMTQSLDGVGGYLHSARWAHPHESARWVEINSWLVLTHGERWQTNVCLSVPHSTIHGEPPMWCEYDSFEAAQRKAVEFMLNNPVEFDFWADRKH